MNAKTINVGKVYVDSGQILICDPCYIDSRWKKEDFNPRERYFHTGQQKVLELGVDFARFDLPVGGFEGKSMNDMIESGEVKELEYPPAKHVFSYNACCVKTLSNRLGGKVDLGIAISSGEGDGSYPVFALVEDNIIKQVIIKFD